MWKDCKNTDYNIKYYKTIRKVIKTNCFKRSLKESVTYSC